MSIEFVFRLIGMILLGIAGAIWGNSLGKELQSNPITTAVVVGLVGALAGLILTPYFTTRPVRTLRKNSRHDRKRRTPPQASDRTA